MYIFKRTSFQWVNHLSFPPSTAPEQTNVYPSQTYNTSFSPPPSSVPPPAQEDIGGPRKNGDPNTQEHAVVNFTAANTRDKVTIHTGKALQRPLNLLCLLPSWVSFVHILNIWQTVFNWKSLKTLEFQWCFQGFNSALIFFFLQSLKLLQIVNA